MLTIAVVDGTGKNADVRGFSVAGKTGTARKLFDGEYSSKAHVALFAGIIPAHAPRLVAVVVIDHPRSKKYTGGQVAAPVFSEIMYEATRLLNIRPGNEQKKTRSEKFATIQDTFRSSF